ncbi:MAG TPA: alpha/beta fold hydrolase [Xanthobacteraceae bacterium]|nr:alpha/beta fold hydrolase [Xanthobacteraceae bacterium]
MAKSQVRRFKLWQDRIDTEVETSGEGPPLVWLHGPWGLNPDRAFIERLASHYTVHAPRFPGTTPGDPNSVHELVGWYDLTVYCGELFERLGVTAPMVAGHSFGALLGAEIAAASPRSVSRLVLIDPVGLWRDDLPVTNWMVLSDKARRAALFADPEGDATKRFFTVPSDPDARLEALSQMVWSQACTGKFVWPIADRGLKRRIHRIAAPTLIVWGKADGVIDAAYADEFAKRIAGARVERIAGAGHLPHLEQPEAVGKAVAAFLGR